MKSNVQNTTDESEPGIEDPTDPPTGLDSYPLDTLLIRSEPRVIADVLRRIEKDAIKLDPDFERDFVWDDARQSRLIESVLMRIPLPVFYLAENRDGNLIVVDGLQRLTTFRRFRTEALVLDIESSRELHGKKFSDLPPKLQDRFEDGPLTFYLIDPKVPDRVRLDIFERVNSGVPLTRQQMRNALYNGRATQLVREMANSTAFVTATGGALTSDRHKRDMKDREAVNRFLGYFYLGWRQYGPAGMGDFDDFLGATLRALNEDPHEAIRCKKAFLHSMAANVRIFSKHAFRKSTTKDPRRSALNLALFDVFSVGLARYDAKRLTVELESSIRSAFHKLLRREEFSNAISYATARVENVHTRFRLVDDMLTKVLGAP
jgi:hypothetical protein